MWVYVDDGRTELNSLAASARTWLARDESRDGRIRLIAELPPHAVTANLQLGNYKG